MSSVTSDPNHNRTLAVPQTDSWVGEMVNATMTSAAAAGILYWSLRTHADEGGFHVRRAAFRPTSSPPDAQGLNPPAVRRAAPAVARPAATRLAASMAASSGSGGA